LEELTNHMAGGAELASLKHELAQVPVDPTTLAPPRSIREWTQASRAVR
ncbi:sugar ABC transporter ATP-binding protein, partial [Streptomyces sp. NPDC050698]